MRWKGEQTDDARINGLKIWSLIQDICSKAGYPSLSANDVHNDVNLKRQARRGHDGIAMCA